MDKKGTWEVLRRDVDRGSVGSLHLVKTCIHVPTFLYMLHTKGIHVTLVVHFHEVQQAAPLSMLVGKRLG